MLYTQVIVHIVVSELHYPTPRHLSLQEKRAIVGFYDMYIQLDRIVLCSKMIRYGLDTSFGTVDCGSEARLLRLLNLT
jgi:hypothetical protein